LTPGGVDGGFVINECGVRLGFLGDGVFSPGSSTSGLSSNTIGPGLPFRSCAPCPPCLIGVSFSLSLPDSVPAGEVELLRDLKASFRRPTGEGLLRCDADVGAFSVFDREDDVLEFTEDVLSVFVNGPEITVSVVIKGEDAVR
jgi:hypothetical protein